MGELAEASQILVVDDDEVIRETLADVLRDEGFSVSSASNGSDALDYLASHHPPRVIVLDLVMPVMSGAEFRERQLAQPLIAGIPVIVMSAANQGSSVATTLRAVGFLPKPPSMEALIDSVARYC